MAAVAEYVILILDMGAVVPGVGTVRRSAVRGFLVIVVAVVVVVVEILFSAVIVVVIMSCLYTRCPMLAIVAVTIVVVVVVRGAHSRRWVRGRRRSVLVQVRLSYDPRSWCDGFYFCGFN